jgi:hypothetical protein
MKHLIIAALIAAPAAHAEFLSGNQLLTRIDSAEIAQQGVALGYVMGVHDSLRSVTHCSPPDITSGQLRDMVRQYLVNNPQNRHLAADSLVGHVLKSVWPCKNQGNSNSRSL